MKILFATLLALTVATGARPQTAPDTNYPVSIGYNGNNTAIGHIDDKIYIKPDPNIAWEYKTTLPFNLNGRVLYMAGKDSILVQGPGDSLIYFDLATGNLSRTTIGSLMTDFCKKQVQQVVYEVGSSGCFFRHSDCALYEREGDHFTLSDKNSSGNNHRPGLPDGPDEIQTELVDSFIAQLPSSMNILPTLASLHLTRKEIDRCGKEITSVAPATLDSIIRYNPIISTTANWITVRFRLADGQTLTLSNTYFDPSQHHFSWRIRLNSAEINKSALSVNRFISASYPDFLPGSDHGDIVASLAAYLSHRQ